MLIAKLRCLAAHLINDPPGKKQSKTALPARGAARRASGCSAAGPGGAVL